jgi:hypothetical protein
MKYLVTLCFIVVLQSHSFCQDTTHVKYRITITPTQFIFLDFPVTIEKVFNRQTIGLTISYRPAPRNSGEIKGGTGGFGYYLDQGFRNQMYNAVTIGLLSKYYLSNFRKLYLEANPFYRYWWFDNKQCSYDNVEGYNFDATRSETINEYGFKLFFGKSVMFRSKGKIKPVLDAFIGAGIRYKEYVYETYNGTVNGVYYTYKKETGNNWDDQHTMSYIPQITIQGGIRFGIIF